MGLNAPKTTILLQGQGRPALCIIIKMFFHSFSATVRQLLLKERSIEPAVFAEITPFYSFVSQFGPFLDLRSVAWSHKITQVVVSLLVVNRFSQKRF